MPFGLRGTVVGLVDQRAEVLFDEQFMRGTNLTGRYVLMLLFTVFSFPTH